MYTKDQVLSALETVMFMPKKDNIISLKMVRNIKIEGNKISFTLLCHKKDEQFTTLLKQSSVKKILEELGPDADIKGNITVQFDDAEELLPNVKNVIAVASGKGGVGKSTVAANLAIALSKTGAKVALVDADIYGPSIPIMFGVEDEKPMVKEVNGKTKVIPIERYGIKMLSIGFFVDPNQALIWRGPLASGALKQLFGDALWGDIDFMIVDLPPGTGDIHISLVQEVPVTAAIIVSTPQKVALSDVKKAANMFRMKNISVPILGIIENMAYFTPPELPDNKYFIFGKNGCENFAKQLHVPFLGQIPISESICESGDAGKPIVLDNDSPVSKALKEITDSIIKWVEIRNVQIKPTEKVKVDPNI